MAMKKLSVLMIALMAMTTVSAQNVKNQQLAKTANKIQQSDTLQFMTAYRQFAAYVASQPALTKTVVDSIKVRQDTLMHQYRKIKPQLTNAQVQEYNTLKGRYTKKLLTYRGNKIGEGLEATGDSIANAAERVGSAVGGFFKGVFKK